MTKAAVNGVNSNTGKTTVWVLIAFLRKFRYTVR